MALLSPAEAAIQTGYSVELLEKLTSYAEARRATKA